MRVLVADDSQLIRKRLVDRLSTLSGVQVAEAEDTPDALSQVEAFKPDLVVLDIRMPGGGGIRALGDIKAKWPDTTVIIMTNYPYAQYRRKCLDAGADFFFDKSTEFEQVAEIVRLLDQTGKTDAVAHRTAAAQLVEAKEELEKSEQRQRDMGILSLLLKPESEGSADQAYTMWERTFDAMPDLVAVFDAGHRIVRVNKTMAERLGVPAVELAGKNCFEYIHGTDCPADGCPHQAMLRDLKEHSEEFYCNGLGGWFDVRISPILENGQLIGAIHIARDVTRRKQIEAAVQKSEKDLRYVISAIFNGLWDWDIENDTVKCNAQWYQMLGYEPDEFKLSHGCFKKMIHPDDRPGYEAAVCSYLSGVMETYSVEFRLHRKDGTYAYILERGSLVERNAAGEPFRMIGVDSDITAKREVEKALKASEMRYRQMFESMQSGFALHEIICDEDGVPCDYRFLEVNPAFETLAGLKAGQLIGKTAKEILPANEFQWIESYGMVALTGVPMRFESFSGMLNRHYSVSVYSPQKGQFVTVFSDITEQKNAQEAVRRARDAAEEANRAKTQLLANMSHELRTPLNAIIGLTELMKDSTLDEEQRDYINTIGDSGESLLGLISDLFDFSAMESGEMKLLSEPFAVREVVDKAIVLFLPLAASKGIELTAQVDEAVPGQITGDPKRLRQVLVSLLQNAFKFTKKGFVRVTVKYRTVPSGRSRIEFAVEDSGAGMSPVTMTRIFDAFQQGDGSNTRQYGGAGMGLTLSRKLVELMGGAFQVKSCEGKGSLFSFYILDQSEQPRNEEAASFCGQWRGRRICIWADDPADMHTAECLLERCGAILSYKENSEEIADGLAGELPGDVVLCNLDLPGLAEKLVELRKIQPDVPWIAFSRWMTPLDDSIRDCFSAFIDRPLERDQLCTALELFLDSTS